MYMCIYISVYICVCACVYTHVERQRQRYKEIDRYTKIIENNITKTPTFHTQNKHLSIFCHI